MAQKEFADWSASRAGIWRTDDPTYFIGKDRFGGVGDKTDTFAGWILHLSGKHYFTPASETNFIRAFEYMKQQNKELTWLTQESTP